MSKWIEYADDQDQTVFLCIAEMGVQTVEVAATAPSNDVEKGTVQWGRNMQRWRNDNIDIAKGSCKIAIFLSLSLSQSLLFFHLFLFQWTMVELLSPLHQHRLIFTYIIDYFTAETLSSHQTAWISPLNISEHQIQQIHLYQNKLVINIIRSKVFIWKISLIVGCM